MISNCAAAGADSIATGPAGIVQRKNEQTGQVQAAAVRPNGVPEQPQNTHLTSVSPAASTLAALLMLQET